LQQYTFRLEKLGKQTDDLSKDLATICSDIVEKRYADASKAFRDEAAKKKLTAEKLFSQLAKNDKISEADFCKRLKTLEGTIDPEHAKLLCRQIERAGITQRSFLSFVQLYYVVTKDNALTDEKDIKSGNIIRKVEKKEILEVLEGPVADEESGVTRIRVRSLLDGASGWATVRGSQGTPFMEQKKKPYYSCRKELTLDKTPEAGGGSVRMLKDFEVLEFVEGPRSEIFPDTQRAKVKASKDGVQGWVTLRDRDSTVFAEANTKLYVCKAPVAMTDSSDIQSSKVIRKLAIDETFMADNGELHEDPASGIFRLQGKAMKDGKKGWITTKGNAGTVFAELMPKVYSVLKDVNVYKGITEDSKAVVRKLEAGETMQVLEGPKEEKVESESRIKVRALSDKALGWISEKAAIIKPWNPVYKCTVSTPIKEKRACDDDTKTIRDLTKGELIEHVEGPFFDGEDIVMKGRAKKDGAMGYIVIKSSEGKRNVEC